MGWNLTRIVACERQCDCKQTVKTRPTLGAILRGMPTLSDRFEEALVLATCLHAEQRRKGTNIPYAAHLLAVASIALEHGADEDEAIAALLHDAVEDQGGAKTLEEIRRRFGDRVASIV